MTTLNKIVLVNASGNWLEMFDDQVQAKEFLSRWPDCRLELWSYNELPDGTHDAPGKQPLSVCSRCGKLHVPLDAGRTVCVTCYVQQRADANLQRMASEQPSIA